MQTEICVSVSGLQSVMDGWIDSSNALNKRCIVLSPHRLTAKAKNQLEKPLEAYTPGMELTGVFIYSTVAPFGLVALLGLGCLSAIWECFTSENKSSASRFHFKRHRMI